MKLAQVSVGMLVTNCYLVADDHGRCAVIDPGSGTEKILKAAEENGFTIEAILLTHGHFDHVGGVKQIAAETGCRVYICKEDLALNPMLTDGAIYYTDTYAEGDTVELAGLRLQVMQTPGHTPGCVCLVCEDVIFCGDTLFAGTCGRTDLPGGSGREIQRSLGRLAGLEGDYRVLPGHGETTTLDTERKTNPFMQGL